MDVFFSQFHLLRPLWLIALVPAFVFFVLLFKRQLTSARWHGIIDKNLMPHVLDQMPTEQARWPLWFVLLAWILSCIALAGPTWQQLPQPVQKKEDALVIVLDMSLSMAAQDVSPDRATRARQKVIDILNQRKEGLTALVVYAGDAYTVTPLTDDSETIINLVPALSPFIMPAMGSRPDKALILARKLIEDSGLTKANFLLITDGILKKDIARIRKSLGANTQQLSVLTLGTEAGAPIAMQGEGFKRDSNGNIVLPKLDLDLIKDLANTLGIRWHQMSYDDRDWQYLLPVNTQLTDTDNQANTPLERHFDLWADEGYWLIFIILFIAAFSFRRGWMLSVIFLVSLQPQDSFADAWQNAWKTQDQQGQELFDHAPDKAAEIFQDPNWKASSFYRAKDYQQAAENFTANPESPLQEQASTHFNRGNALAHTGKLEQAIKAYEQALELDDSLKDAEFNKSLVEQLLEQQEKEEQDSDKSDSDKSNSDKSDSDKSNSDESDSDKSDSDKSDSDESDSDKSDSDKSDSDESDSDESDSDESDSDESDSDKSDSDESDSDKNSSENDSKQENSDTKDSEQKNADEQDKDAQTEQKQPAQATDADELSNEEKQALKQWLNRVPDDPGGLLKRKFLYQYQQREHQDEGEVSW